MAQINITDQGTINRLQTDPAFRADFLANTEKMMTQLGHPVNQQTLGAVLDSQLGPVGNPQAMVAGTNVNINIF